jgi:TonB family protein
MRRKLLRHRRYPPAALRTGLQGIVQVKIAVDRRGRLVGEPVVVKSSGHPVLDAEALRIARVASPFDPLPSNASKDVHRIVIPIDFHIDR